MYLFHSIIHEKLKKWKISIKLKKIIEYLLTSHGRKNFEQ